MTRSGFNLSAAVLLVLLAAAPGVPATATNDTPDFKEVFDLVRAHLAGAGEAELNRAAVEGLLASLHGKVSLAGSGMAPAPTNASLVSKSFVLENDVAYVRVGRVDAGLAKEVSRAHEQLSATNKLKGLVLDLRFAGGDDYAAAAAVADLFTARKRLLLDWGSGTAESKAKTDTLLLPVAVLVNRETGGAAEALAAVMRETGAGLILGSATAGRAMMTQEFPLKNGQRLRIATSPVKLGDGTALSAQGVKPDIEVAVSVGDERAYFKDAYTVLSGTNTRTGAELALAGLAGGTNPPVRRSHLTEAELVREKREGFGEGPEFAPDRETEPSEPQINDPALARAVDLLKGLAVVRPSRS